MHTFPPVRNLLQTCFRVLPQEDLHSFSVWLLQVFELYSLQISERIFFLSLLAGFFSCLSWFLALIPRFVLQFPYTWASSSVERKGCPFSQLSPFLLKM